MNESCQWKFNSQKKIVTSHHKCVFRKRSLSLQRCCPSIMWPHCEKTTWRDLWVTFAFLGFFVACFFLWQISSSLFLIFDKDVCVLRFKEYQVCCMTVVCDYSSSEWDSRIKMLLQHVGPNLNIHRDYWDDYVNYIVFTYQSTNICFIQTLTQWAALNHRHSEDIATIFIVFLLC